MSSHIFSNIDGPLFRRQREFLLRLAHRASRRKPCNLTQEDRDLLDGLIDLTDAIADEAHDHYGKQCLIT